MQVLMGTDNELKRLEARRYGAAARVDGMAQKVVDRLGAGGAFDEGQLAAVRQAVMETLQEQRTVGGDRDTASAGRY